MPDTFILLLYVCLMVLTFLFIGRIISWFLHKYIMQGFGWFLHEDHYRYAKSRFQKNYSFTIFYSIVTILLLIFGFFRGFDYRFLFVLGIFFYGMGFAYQKMVFHRRIKIRYRPKNKYLLLVINAYRMHYQKSPATDGVNFEFFIVGKQYETT